MYYVVYKVWVYTCEVGSGLVQTLVSHLSAASLTSESLAPAVVLNRFSGHTQTYIRTCMCAHTHNTTQQFSSII